MNERNEGTKGSVRRCRPKPVPIVLTGEAWMGDGNTLHITVPDTFEIGMHFTYTLTEVPE